MSDRPEFCGAPDMAQDSPARQRVTLALFAYNQQAHVRAAVEGALAQDYDGPLEIILSDDGSRDDTFAVMQDVARAYSGPHHVRLNYNDHNLGLSAHVNRVLAMAQGEIIVMAAGDDISLPGRVTETVAAFARHPEAIAVSFTDIRMDDSGAPLEDKVPSGPEQIIDLEMFLAAGPRAQTRLGLSGASRAFRRKVYERFGDLRPDCPAEDSPYLLRILYIGKLVVCGGPGILYRVHDAQMSSSHGIAAQSGQGYQSQMIKDARFARNMSLISWKQRKLAENFANEIKIMRDHQRFVYTKSKPNLRLVYGILLSNRHSSREKFGIIRRFIMNIPFK